MKTASKFFATLLFVSLALVACDKGGGGDGGGGGKKGDLPPVEITNEVQGAVKAGEADVIEINGTGFDPEADWVQIGFDGDGETNFEQIKDDVLTITKTRISFGVNVGARFIGKTVKVYLDRGGYDKMPISGDITFTLPAVAEGYIPDPVFRAWLNNPKTNPDTAKGFNAYGMLNPQVAAEATELELGGCEAVSLEGIELFSSLKLLKGWNMPNLVEADLSKLTAMRVDIRLERALKLEKLVTPPWAITVLAHNCPKLTYVDAHNSSLLSRLEISEQKSDAAISAVTMLDIRKNHSQEQFSIWGGDSFFKVADNATIKIDSWFLWDHNTGTSSLPAAWSNVYDAWKNRGATVEVYSRVDPHRDVLLGTVPSPSDSPNALSPANKNSEGGSANEWTIEDTYVN